MCLPYYFVYNIAYFPWFSINCIEDPIKFVACIVDETFVSYKTHIKFCCSNGKLLFYLLDICFFQLASFCFTCHFLYVATTCIFSSTTSTINIIISIIGNFTINLFDICSPCLISASVSIVDSDIFVCLLCFLFAFYSVFL